MKYDAMLPSRMYSHELKPTVYSTCLRRSAGDEMASWSEEASEDKALCAQLKMLVLGGLSYKPNSELQVQVIRPNFIVQRYCRLPHISHTRMHNTPIIYTYSMLLFPKSAPCMDGASTSNNHW